MKNGTAQRPIVIAIGHVVVWMEITKIDAITLIKSIVAFLLFSKKSFLSLTQNYSFYFPIKKLRPT